MGFIGSVMLKDLNKRGISDIIVVDEGNDPVKKRNLEGKSYSRFMEKEEFLTLLKSGNLKPSEVESIIHLGACSSTTETNAEYLKQNNTEYSKALALWCFEHDKYFMYASSAATYGDGKQGFSDDEDKLASLKPLNLYGWSKHEFDVWLREEGYDLKCIGFKYFNVFGPNEYHKGSMASLVYKAYGQILNDSKIRLFRSHDPRYTDGEFYRDFIYVKDCIDVMLWAMDNKEVHGLFNLGTGIARSWNDLAKSLFSAMGKETNIEYIDMPIEIRNAYQYYTCAEMDKLRAAGYAKPFTTLEDSVRDYVVSYLSVQDCYY